MQLVRTLSAALSLLVSPSLGMAITCELIGKTCESRASIAVAGFTINSACAEEKLIMECTGGYDACEAELMPYLDTVSPPGDGKCVLREEVCTSTVDGYCVESKRTYDCLNGPGTTDSLTLVDRQFINFRDDIITDCDVYENDPACQLEYTNILEGFERRTINFYVFTRDWWRREKVFHCGSNTTVDECADFRNDPVCTLQPGERCLAETSDGFCTMYEYHYECLSQADYEATCTPVNICVGGICDVQPTEASDQFPVAAAWLKVLDEMAKDTNCEAEPDALDDGELTMHDCVNSSQLVCGWDNLSAQRQQEILDYYDTYGVPAPNSMFCEERDMGPTEPTFFSGKEVYCRYNGIWDCCENPDLLVCDADEEHESYYKREAGAASYFETICTDDILGLCVLWNRIDCTYDTKFGRVFQEQANKQLGTQFDKWAPSNRCPGLTLSQLYDLDMEKMNFNEVISDALADTKDVLYDVVIDKVQAEVTKIQGLP